MPVNGLTELVLAGLAALAPLTAGPGKTGEVPLLPGHRAVAVAGPVSMSADGARVAFTAKSNRFVKFDRNKDLDVYVFDRRSRTLRMLSRARNGRPGKLGSGQPQISRSGRFVVFASASPDLVKRDTNKAYDVFMRPVKGGRTRRISVGPGGSQANGPSLSPVLSADGTHAAFLSAASNLVPGDGNGRPDVFVADLRSGAVQRIDAGAAGAVNDALPQPFTSRALERAPGLAISADGSKVAYVARTNGRAGVYVHDFAAATTERVSVATGGAPADGDSDRPLMTADGNLVFFSSRATNLLAAPTADGALLVRDRAAGTTAPAALDTAGDPLNPGGTEQSTPLAISPDGRFLAFVTNVARISTTRTSAHELVLADRSAGTLEMLSVDSAGRPGNNVVEAAAISDDGRTAIFETGATNLIPKGGGRNSHGFRHALYVRTRG